LTRRSWDAVARDEADGLGEDTRGRRRFGELDVGDEAAGGSDDTKEAGSERERRDGVGEDADTEGDAGGLPAGVVIVVAALQGTRR
jgi:hypothetical protein